MSNNEGTPQSDTSPFPAGLLSWAGHRRGGVKKPFKRDTGRPAGVRITTPLMERLQDWVQKLVAGESVPRALILVGGPGNGKTDMVEGIIEDLDQELRLDGKLFEAFGRQYTGSNAKNPPRRTEVELGSMLQDAPSHLNCTISLVQDATEKDPSRFPGQSARQLLLSDLDEIIDQSHDGIYICCVNRGKLAEAYTEAQLRDPSAPSVALLEEITGAVTNSPRAKSCWPLEQHPSIVAWPMDIDSLVEKVGKSEAPIHKLLEKALDKTRWPDSCPAGKMCPFCTNREILSKDGSIANLAEVLRAFELGTGKRWTFRDLYSLVPYILVGSEEHLVIDGESYDPCEWAAKQVDLLNTTSSRDAAKRARAPYLLSSALYWHRLFPLWPKLSSKIYTDAERKIVGSLHGELQHIKDLMRFLRWPGRTKVSGSLEKIITGSFCRLLDPADAAPETVISKATTSDLTVQEIDEYFSLSVEQGAKKVSKRVTYIEREILKRISSADEALGTDAISTQNQVKAEILQRCLRQFSARFVKRSLGVQSGAFAQQEGITGFKEALSDPRALRKIQTELKRLLNDSERNLFITPLMTTFAQPPPPRRRNVSLETTAVKVLPWKTDEAARPAAQQIYLKVDDSPVPLTYDLYNALDKLSKGMHPGSLSDETFAMVGRIRAQVAGVVVRDEDRWLDDAVIVVDPTREEIQYTGEKFSVNQL